MLKPYVALVALLLCTFWVTAQEAQGPAQTTSSSTIPADTVHQANPVKPTAESLAQGKKYYGYDCAMCHGEKGNGKGEVAIDEKMELENWTDPAALKGKTDGELFYIIKNGKGKMPPEGDRVKPTELWNMVNYIRSLSNQKGQ
jgi:mono/diheme cytochrome c family protein